MTENEAINEIIKEVCSGCYGSDEEPHRCSTCGFKMAKDALKENRQYHALGTVEELQQIRKVIDDFALDCGGIVSDVKEICYQLHKYLGIGSIEELQALKEKAEPKKPIIVHKQTCQLGTEVEWKCPVCGRNCIELAPCQKYCADCGTKFAWS